MKLKPVYDVYGMISHYVPDAVEIKEEIKQPIIDVKPQNKRGKK